MGRCLIYDEGVDRLPHVRPVMENKKILVINNYHV